MKPKVYLTIFFASIIIIVQSAVELKKVYANGMGIRPPFNGTYRTVAYFDHDSPNYGTGANDYNWIYNGEQVPASYPNATGEPYPYDGHDGWDWSMGTGTDILAVADGNVILSVDSMGCYGHTIIIEHDNEYYTMYTHLNQRLVGTGALVLAGQHIGESGNSVGPGCSPVGAHLHFGVRHGGHANTTYAVDPFGWRGAGRDPLFDFNEKESTCLWRSHDDDPISCNDTVVEDAAAGSVHAPGDGWRESVYGNGYHTFYRSNTALQQEYHTWSTSAISNTLRPGPAKFYAFVAEDPDGNDDGLVRTGEATYYVWATDDWYSVQLNQSDYHNEWAALGTFRILGHASVGLWAQTSEAEGTRWVMADGLKLRQYHLYLPALVDRRRSKGQTLERKTSLDGAGWAISGTRTSVPALQPYIEGEAGIRLSDADSSASAAYHDVALPGSASRATLSFWWWVASHEGYAMEADFLHVRVRDTSGRLLQTVATFSNRGPQGAWQFAEIDLSAYAGQRVRVAFEVEGNAQNATYFWLDDINLMTKE